VHLADLLAYDFLRHALLAGLAASVLCGVVGTLMVVKRLVFFGAGLSHAAFGGLGLCHFLGLDPTLGAGVVAVAAALALGGDDRRRPRDATIGILWAVGMAAGIVLIHFTPGYAPDLMTYLFGNVLAVGRREVILVWVLAAAVALAFAAFYRETVAVAFDEEFAAVQGVPTGAVTTVLLLVTALSVVFLIQLVGIVLVIALLTVPPVVALTLFRDFKRVVLAATLFGAVMTTGGLAVSYAFDLPSGPAMVLLGAAFLPVAEAVRRLRGRHATAEPTGG
jgi:zinc transport system permease protein